jgi:hypothetical protein
MYGLTRATITLIAAAAGGLLIWFATQINDKSVGGFWAVYGLIAGAGLVMALSQLLGGWTKWGWPRLAFTFLLTAFVPIAVVSIWIVLAAEPGNGWFHRHVLSWSSEIHIRSLVNDLKAYVSVFAFGIGLAFGYSFDTAGPAVRGRAAVADRTTDTVPPDRGRRPLGRRRPVRTTSDGHAADEALTADRDATTTSRDRERVS